MPFRHISPDLKERAVWLKNNGWLTGNICAILGISDESLRRWCQNVEQFRGLKGLGLFISSSLPATCARRPPADRRDPSVANARQLPFKSSSARPERGVTSSAEDRYT